MVLLDDLEEQFLLAGDVEVDAALEAQLGAENVAWTCRGEAPDWEAARLAVIAALRELAAAPGRQEYRVRIDGQNGIVTPGLDADGRVALADLDRALPGTRYWN